MKDDKLNLIRMADHITLALRENLESFVGHKVTHTTTKQVKEDLQASFEGLQERGLIAQESGFKVGEVNILWQTWNWKKRLKWTFCNKTPLIKLYFKAKKKAIDDYNLNIYLLEELENPPEDIPDSLEMPEHLISGPKSIIITNMEIRPVQSIEYITLDMELSND